MHLLVAKTVATLSCLSRAITAEPSDCKWSKGLSGYLVVHHSSNCCKGAPNLSQDTDLSGVGAGFIMATAVSSFQRVSCCTTTTWQPRASVAGRPAGCPNPIKLFPGTKVGARGRLGVFQRPDADLPPHVISKGAWQHFVPAVRCAATRQLTECAPVEQGELTGTSPIVNLFGPAFLSGRTEQVDNAVGLLLESYQVPLIEAPPAGAALPLDASCHILTGSREIAEDQILQAHIDALSEEQAMLEASFQAPHDGPLILPDSLDLRLSGLSPVAAVDEPPPENTIQKLHNMLMDTARLLGALVLASVLALCTPHPALAARSMCRAGGGGFSSSRSSGGSSRSSSSSSSRSSSSSSSRSSSSSSGRSSSSSGRSSTSSSGSRSSTSSSRRSSSSSGGSSGLGFHWGSNPTSHSSSHSSDSHGHSSGHSNTGGHSPSHSDSHEKSGVKAGGGGAAGKSPRPKPPPNSSEKHRWFGSASHDSEEPHLNSQMHSDTSASIHLHLSGPTWPHPSSHPGAYHYSDTHDRLLRAFFRSLSGEDRSKETGQQQQQAGAEVPRTPKEAAADAEAQNASFPDVLTVFGITVSGFLVIMILALWAEDYENRMRASFERKDPRNDNTGTVREGSGYAVADASRALERTRADVSKSRAPEGTRAYDFDTNVKNLITVVKIQVALLGQAKSVQVQMDKLCEEADTDSKVGLHNLLTETLLVILRHSTYWAYGNAQMIPLGYDAAERRYQQIALEERSKAEQETLVNKGGKLTKMPSVRDTEDEPPPNEFIVVTVLAAVKGRLEARDGADRVAPRENVKGALQGLSQVQAGDLEVLDILWVPQEDDDTLTHAELIENFTDLSPM